MRGFTHIWKRPSERLRHRAAQRAPAVKAGDVHAVGCDAMVCADAEEGMERVEIAAAHLQRAAGVKAAAGGQEHQIFCPAKALQALRAGAEGDAVDADVLNIDFQERRKGQVPEGRGNHDFVRLCKLMRQGKARVRKRALIQKPLPGVEKFSRQRAERLLRQRQAADVQAASKAA